MKPTGSTVTVALITGNVEILVVRATDPNVMIPVANYRKEIATRSLQRDLFGDAEPSADARLYGVILHGGDNGGAMPSFIRVRFPTADHVSYLDPSS